MLWLKKIDCFSALVPKRICTSIRSSTAAASERTAIVRPGGLGDLVVLTEACLAIGIDPRSLVWFVEPRNAIWLDYLGIDYICYNSIHTLRSVVLGKYSFQQTIVTEQFHGLASIFASRITSRNGCLSGFSANPRSDVFDVSVDYSPDKNHEIDSFSTLLSASDIKFHSSITRAEYPIPSADPISNRFVVVGIGGLQDPERRMTIENWLKLLSMAEARQNNIVLLGHPNDRNFAEQLCAAYSKPIENLVGKISFSEVIRHLRFSQRFFGLDSGLVHVSDFFGVPSDVLILTQKAVQWGPRTPGSKALYREKLE